MSDQPDSTRRHQAALRQMEAQLGDSIRTSLFYELMADEDDWCREDAARSDARRRDERRRCDGPRLPPDADPGARGG